MIQPDSILNEKTGQKIPVAYSQMIVQVNEKSNTLNMVITGLLSFIGSICVIVALVYFIKLIISINKSTIFDWKNVKRLRIMGYALLIQFLLYHNSSTDGFIHRKAIRCIGELYDKSYLFG